MAEASENSLENLFTLNESVVANIGAQGFAAVMAVSLVSSWIIALLYVKFYGSRATGSQIHRSFPLLGMSVTAIFICIQFSLPLSLGLLGALSIVRFRTPIKEPEEIGFIMLVIGASIAAATFSLYFLILLLLFAVLALVAQDRVLGAISRKIDAGTIILTLDQDREAGVVSELKSLLENNVENLSMESVSKSGEFSVITYSFKRLRTADPVSLQEDIQKIAGARDINVYLNRQATL